MTFAGKNKIILFTVQNDKPDNTNKTLARFSKGLKYEYIMHLIIIYH